MHLQIHVYGALINHGVRIHFAGKYRKNTQKSEEWRVFFASPLYLRSVIVLLLNPPATMSKFPVVGNSVNIIF